MVNQTLRQGNMWARFHAGEWLEQGELQELLQDCIHADFVYSMSFNMMEVSQPKSLSRCIAVLFARLNQLDSFLIENPF